MAEHQFWQEEYSVGYKPVDAQHMRIIGLLRKAHETVKNGGSPEKTRELLQDLNGHLNTHFKYEETVMRVVGYYALQDHKREHRNLLERIAGLREALLQGRLKPAGLPELLREWWVEHILVKDMKYAGHLRRERARLRRFEAGEMVEE